MRGASAGGWLILAIYQVVLVIVGAGYLTLRLIRGRGVPGFIERLGGYSGKKTRVFKTLTRPIWLHLVSVGEVLAARPLVQELKARFPNRPWVISTVTPGGQSMAQQIFRESNVQQIYLPWDLSPVVHRTLNRIDPCIFVSFETELWPVLFHHLYRRRVPILVVNGRISPRAFRRYLWLRPLVAHLLSRVTFFLTQSPQDARRYAALGAPKDRISITGNLKWDVTLSDGGEHTDSLRVLLRLNSGSLLWTAGSTHRGEEKLILKVYQRLRRQHPHVRLLIAPRHPERVPEVEREVLQAGFRPLRRSRFSIANSTSETVEPAVSDAMVPAVSDSVEPAASDNVVVLDTLGELARFYRISDLVFVGGSLVAHGGHNLMEPAALSRAILSGPYLANFQAAAESLLRAGGMVVVQTSSELEAKVDWLLKDPQARQELGRKAYEANREHRGATDRTADILSGILEASCR